jgi:putative heme-binding domain-containing protein
VGPDLSNLVHRDYDSVLRDIQNPSAALNPDHIASTVRLKDGSVYNGIIRSVGEKFIVRGDYEGEAEPISRDQVAFVAPSTVSIMPPGLDQGLGAAKMRDLMTFLLTRPLEPAAIEQPNPPAPRSRGEVESAIANSAPLTSLKALNILLVAGPKDHGPSEHDYPAWQRRWSTLLRLADNVTVATADRWPTADQWKSADVAVFYSANPDWSADKAKDTDAHLAKGGGLVFIHFAVNGQAVPELLADRIGLAWRNGASRFRHGALDLTLRDHSITRNLTKLKLIDESYWSLVGDPKRINLLAAAPEDGADRPLLWTLEKGGGRVFVSIPGHYSWTFDDPLFRLLILRGIAWTAKHPVDRFNDILTIGARVQE